MRRRLLLLAAGVFAACAAARAQSPASKWRTIDTAHFRVHFPVEFEPWARRAAGAIEGIHDRVTEAVGYRTTRPIDVVVADPQATANGMAFPFLDRPAIVLWTSPPEPESAIGLLDGLDGGPRHARGRPHRAPRAPAQPLARDPRQALAAALRAPHAEFAALARRGLRHGHRGIAHGIRPPGLEPSRHGAAPLRDRGEAPGIRRALRDERLARRIDGVPGGIDLPRVARSPGGSRNSPEALEADGLAARRRLPDRVPRGVRAVARRPVRPLPRGDHRRRDRGGAADDRGGPRRGGAVAAARGRNALPAGLARRHEASRPPRSQTGRDVSRRLVARRDRGGSRGGEATPRARGGDPARPGGGRRSDRAPETPFSEVAAAERERLRGGQPAMAARW